MIKPGFGSHLPILIKAFDLTQGSVLECGTGYNSTPVLHWLCRYYNRSLRSLESVRQYYKLNKAFNDENHSVEFVKNWEDVVFDNYGLVFIDCKPAGQRKEIARALFQSAGMIVLHDTQQKQKAMEAYQYESIYPLFRHIYHAEQPFNTSVLSNYVNVRESFSKKEE
jgi:hypothetical protein